MLVRLLIGTVAGWLACTAQVSAQAVMQSHLLTASAAHRAARKMRPVPVPDWQKSPIN